MKLAIAKYLSAKKWYMQTTTKWFGRQLGQQLGKQLGKWLGLLTAMLLLSACMPTNETKLDLNYIVAADVNPDHNQRPSPVVIRLFELTTPSVFENADFFSLYQQPQQVLSGSLLNQEEHEFSPGTTVQHRLLLHPNTHFVAVLAAYRDIENANWRLVIPVKPKERNKATLLINRLSINLTQ
ncbi:type VI secretion system lipoprotein TssJ [Endozoicomonas sp. SM1973]|uniref:Type VI secretion system lipoprotein TssJ n=1 Tax=Spartinivicinus marinus TaxID=2994442 RepID=A0A853IGG2_9GAMM|nr:type VI secretion system lipoprotein TssJ [Spartinivicinus marinus]NYZ69071.1 type VI secretion system lipoprotein TssJ [Spartinivicinus marinus]